MVTMKTSRRFSTLLTIGFLVTLWLPAITDAHTNPDHSQPITAANIPQLGVINRFGEGLIYGTRWTQRGNLFVECASTGLWLYDGNDVEKPPHLLDGLARCLNFDMNADGTLFAWASNDVNNVWEANETLVYLVDTRTGKQQQYSMSTKGGCTCSEDVQTVALSQDGSLLAAVDEAGVIDVWDIASGKQLFSVRASALFKNRQVVSLDGDLEIRGVGYVVEVREAKTKQVRTRIFGLDTFFTVFSPNGKLVATQYARIINARNGELWANVPGDNTSAVFSPDSKTLAVGRRDGSISFYDPIRLRETILSKGGNSGEVLSLAYRPDGVMLASVGRDAVVRFWDIKAGKQLYAHARGNLALARVRFSPNGKLIAATANRSLYVGNTRSGERYVAQHINEVMPEAQWIYWTTIPLNFSPYQLSFSADGSKVSTSDASDHVSVWDSQTGDLRHVQKIIPGWSAYFAADGTIFTAIEKRVQHLDPTSAAPDSPLQTFYPSVKSSITLLTVSGDSAAIAMSDGQQIQVWDVKTSTKKATINLASDQYVSNLALNVEGTRLAIARENGGIEVWDIQSQEMI